MKGILVTIMGITNIGKTTQLRLLEKSLKEKGLLFQTLKYPVYKHEPTGPRAWNFLKEKNPEGLTPYDFQNLCALNRRDFEPQLIQMLNENHVVIAEMYTGTGIAYGIGDGIPKSDLLEMNKGLLDPDVSILLDGNRYMESVEENHCYENDNEKTEKIRLIHLELSKDLDWTVINANQEEEKIHAHILGLILEHLQKNQANA